MGFLLMFLMMFPDLFTGFGCRGTMLLLFRILEIKGRTQTKKSEETRQCDEQIKASFFFKDIAFKTRINIVLAIPRSPYHFVLIIPFQSNFNK